MSDNQIILIIITNQSFYVSSGAIEAGGDAILRLCLSLEVTNFALVQGVKIEK